MTRKLYYEDCHMTRFTARVLSCCSLYANAFRNKTVHLGTWQANSLFFKVFKHKSKCGFFGNTTDSSRTEHVFGTEQFFSIFMHLALNLT